MINYHTVCTLANTQRVVADNYEKRSFQFTLVKAQKYWPSTGFQDGRDQLSNCIIRPLEEDQNQLALNSFKLSSKSINQNQSTITRHA